MQVSKGLYGLINDQQVLYFTISNGDDFSFTVIEYGATLVSVKFKDNNNLIEELTLCYASLDDLIKNHGPYYGSSIGRVANRIENGTFELDGITYNLAVNNGKNHLHGGKYGFDQRIWKGQEFQTNYHTAGVEFTYKSCDGEENYPGNVEISIRYEVTNQNDLIISYHAVTDKATPINLTNHTYWNLSGYCKDHIYDHTLQLSCSKYLPVNENQIPCEGLVSVENSHFDFTISKSLRDAVLQIDGGGKSGLDHCFAIDHIVDLQYKYNASIQYDIYRNLSCTEADSVIDILNKEGYLHHIATLLDLKTGRKLIVRGTQPGVQIYTANWLPAIGDTGSIFPHIMHNAICLETQHFPDAVNQYTKNKDFESIIIRPENGQIYFHQAVFSFSNLNQQIL